MVRNSPRPAFPSGPGVFTETLDLVSNQHGTRKRPASPAAPNKRIRPTLISVTPLRVTNVSNEETIYQRCLLLKGECHSLENSSEDYVSVHLTDALDAKRGPQHWPVVGGLWKAMIILEPGTNDINIEHHHAGGVSGKVNLRLTYTALNQTSPLHLVILVAKDSPLLINCPPSKYGAISSAHSSLDAAVAKLRMTAYMWQAALANESHEQGLGRRSFRLEEEWSIDTIRRASSSASSEVAMGSVAKVHIIRPDKNMAQLLSSTCTSNRNRDLAYEFRIALEAHGCPFLPSARPVVAGMILDAGATEKYLAPSFSPTRGSSPMPAIQLAVIPSHSVYSWPRFMEEVTSCLVDLTPAEQPLTTGEVCQTNQHQSLDAVMRALGVSEEAISSDSELSWSSQFIANAQIVSDMRTEELQRSLQRALQLRRTAQAQLPLDNPKLLDPNLADAKLDIHLEPLLKDSDTEDTEDPDSDLASQYQLTIRCEAALALISLQHSPTHIRQTANIHACYPPSSIKEYSFLLPLPSLLSPSPLFANILTAPGTLHTINLTTLLQSRSHLLIPGSRLRLYKQSSHPLPNPSNSSDPENNSWALLLAHLNPLTSTLSPATNIDLRVGCTFDGLLIHYADSTTLSTRPHAPHPQHFGGHASANLDLPPTPRISRVEISTRESCCDGIRITLETGEQWGELNAEEGERVVTLEPEPGRTVVGFFGTGRWRGGYVARFGILTAKVGVEMLPEGVWGMREFARRGEGEGEESEGTEC